MAPGDLGIGAKTGDATSSKAGDVEYVDDTAYDSIQGNVSAEPDELPEEKVHAPLTRRQKLVLAACSCTGCFMHLGISSIPLILPPEVDRKKIPYEYVGMIFAIFAFSVVIFEPFQAKILPYLGTKWAFCLASLLGGICYISFAMIDFANTTTSFVAAAMLICFIEGFYYAGLITATNVIVCLEFPNRASFAFGVLEGFTGVGYTLGPLISGALFAAGGFIPPFVFIGVCLLATSVVGFFFLDQVTGMNLEAKQREKTLLLRDPVFIGVSILIFSMGIIWGIFESTLEPYLATYEQGAVVEGVVFAIAYLAYAVASPLWGIFFKRFPIDFRWVLVGPVVAGVLWMVLGPIPVLTFIGQRILWLDATCLFLLNVTVAFVLVFCYDTMMKRAFHWGLEESVATYALIIAAFFTALDLGETVGPIIGGVVYAKLGFPMVAVVASSISYGIAVIGMLALLVNWTNLALRVRRSVHRRFPSWVDEPDDRENASETSSLLGPHKITYSPYDHVRDPLNPARDLTYGSIERNRNLERYRSTDSAPPHMVAI